MARRDRQCLCCQIKYKYCSTCSADQAKPTWMTEFCSEPCKELFATATKYNMEMLTKSEAKEIIQGLELKEKSEYADFIQKDIENINAKKEELLHIARDFDEAIEYVLEVLLKPENKLISSTDEIGAVGHRIVHGGEKFKNSVLIDDEVIKAIKENITLAPLHNPAGLAGIKACRKLLPKTPMVAVFDTSFHQTMEEKAYIYQIPYKYYEDYKIRKYGFHGISHRYVAKRISEII